MSYILDALRKAERERARGRVPSLASADFELVERRRTWPWIASAAGLAVIVALAVWLLVPGGQAPAPAPPIPAEAPVRADPPAPARPSAGVAAAKPKPAPKPSPAAEKRPAAAKAAPPPDAAPAPNRLDQPVEDLAPVRPKVEAEQTPAGAPARGSEAPAPASTPSLPPPAPPQGRPASPPAGMPPPAAPPAASLEEAVAKMTLNVLVYADLPAERIVYIDGRQYAEGQRVQGRYLVERITPDGAVLSANGERTVLQAKPNPLRRP